MSYSMWRQVCDTGMKVSETILDYSSHAIIYNCWELNDSDVLIQSSIQYMQNMQN